MKVNDFIKRRITELETFAKNMETLNITDKTEERLMELYLAWTEWKDPIMHEIIWKNDEL